MFDKGIPSRHIGIFLSTITGDSSEYSIVLRVSVTAHARHGTAIVTVARDGAGVFARYPLFRVDNNCDEAMVLRQGSTGNRPPWTIPARSTRVFGWDDPSADAIVSVRCLCVL